MPKVYLGLGSNVEPRKNIKQCLQVLKDKFSVIEISPVYESEAIGFDGDDFLNLVVGLETELSLAELSAHLKEIEDAQGRDRSAPRFSARTLDVDILTYDDYIGEHSGINLPRDEITKNAFVLLPFADLAPNLKLPGEPETLAQMWQAYDKSVQVLKKTSLD